ncbi:MAG: adenylate/guanylate cyclase domain-containing protein [Pseudonocardiaceae bacterium]|nr:adenylate/guanylate cyclase domain-containing protein [Pseudonocardiaceae bacterium]
MSEPPARSLPLPRALRSAAVEVDYERAGLLEGLNRDGRRARIALLEELAQAGVTLAEMRDAVQQDRLAMLLLERALVPQGRYTEAEVAERTGLEPDALQRWFRALGRPPVSDAGYDDADIALALRLQDYIALGLPEEGMLTVARTIGRGMSSMADAAGALLGEALLEAGDPDPEVALRYATEAGMLVDADSRLLGHVLALNLADRIRSHAIAVAHHDAGRMQGAQQATVGFADLVGFTELGEQIPADELVHVADLLTATATDVVSPPVRLVKTIGDAVMVVSPSTLPLVHTLLDLIDATGDGSSALPPLRAGIASGIAVPHGGDWYGPPVNLASRITASARPGTVLATAAVRGSADAGDLRWRATGVRRFKGVRGNQRLYRVRRPGGS